MQIAKGNRSRVYNKETMDRNRIQRPHPKYYLGEYYKTCWQCCAHGHYKEGCPRHDAQAKKSHRVWNRKDQKVKQNVRKSKGSNHRNATHLARNSLDINIAEYVFFENVFYCKEPGKRHLARVTKN